MSRLKFSLKIWNNILIRGAWAPLGPPPGYALAQDLKKRSLTEKISPIILVLPSHASNRKKPDYYWLSSQVLLHPKLRILRTEIWFCPKFEF